MIETTCCIVGGGPAGMMLGLLLARAKIEVIVAEKHADFFRDFRGDTIHPSSMQVIDELGILEDFLATPHQKVSKLRGLIGDDVVTVADFSKLTVKCPYIALMPQWDFLDFINKHARRYPNFKLLMQTEITDLIIENSAVTGVVAHNIDGLVNIKSKLVIGADGRNSTVRLRAGLPVLGIGAPIDVFWFKLSRLPTEPTETFGRFLPGKILVLINRGSYWQCGYVIPKGTAETYKQGDIAKFWQQISSAVPFLQNRPLELHNWDEVKLLSVKIDRLQRWYKTGLLCIGDAAHAMSPIGGVGINLAIQDAVAAANILTAPLLQGNLSVDDLAKVQQRRTFPVAVIQKIQALMQQRIIYRVLRKDTALRRPWWLKKLQNWSLTQRLIGYLIGIGIRPEHVKQ